jgi:hypothetical protein
MKNTIELLQQEIEKQSKIKLATEKERDANKDVRFIASYSNKINRIDNFILELNRAIEILKL